MRFAFVLLVTVLISACASTPGSSDNPLAGTDWELRALVEGADSLTTLPRDGLHFTDDSGIIIRSCNACNGIYVTEGSLLRTDRMMCTRRACEEGRPELAHLIGDVSTHRFYGDWLIIESTSKRLYFAPGPSWEGN